MTNPKFQLGLVGSTPGALAAFEEAGESPFTYLERHANGDWGTIDQHDLAVNEASLLHDGRLLSAYKLRSGTVVWCITESDRSSTCLLLPSEY